MNAVEAEIKLADEMLRDAELMAEKERTRSAVNRAYYAMFHGTKAVLLFLGTDCQSHAGAINRLGEYVIKKGLLDERLAKSLHRAYRLREKSDYQPMVKISYEEVERLLLEAKEFVKEIKRLLHKLKIKEG